MRCGLVAEGPPHMNKPIGGGTNGQDTDSSACYRQGLFKQNLTVREVVILGEGRTQAACCRTFSTRHGA